MQNRLWIALAVTLALSIVLRLMAPGWTLFLFGIVLILIALVHLIIHMRAMKRVPIAARRYVYLIAFSHLFFFLGFVFQVDGDGSYGRVPILFWLLLSTSESVWPIFRSISTGSFILLTITWLLLESVRMPKKESSSS
jgi:hypothetical protein